MMGRIVGKPHLYRDHLRFYIRGLKEVTNKSGIWDSQICEECKERAVAADEIDDFNSVWFGLGPDMVMAPVGAID